ncbi:MAG: CRISPR-associated protein Cas5 [Flavobacteriaceae bacterium]|nr:CRISPR-associated protein Cas5 [Flavobacteriaceae bacterium]
MEIISFKLKGKSAHFRKYFANNTAFSFSIPPRTTLMGIVAAAMGLSRDSYYEDFSSENLRFGIRVLTPLKKSFHRLNFISLKSTGDMSKNWSNDFRGKEGRIQTPFEIVTPWNLTKGDVEYQIFVTPTDSGKDIFNKFKTEFLAKDSHYNVSLGVANFNATIFKKQLIGTEAIQEVSSTEFVSISSAVPVEKIEKFEFEDADLQQYNFVEEDMLPADFVANYNREVSKMSKLLFSTTDISLRLKLNSPFYKVILNDKESINIVFMD